MRASGLANTVSAPRRPHHASCDCPWPSSHPIRIAAAWRCRYEKGRTWVSIRRRHARMHRRSRRLRSAQRRGRPRSPSAGRAPTIAGPSRRPPPRSRPPHRRHSFHDLGQRVVLGRLLRRTRTDHGQHGSVDLSPQVDRRTRDPPSQPPRRRDGRSGRLHRGTRSAHPGNARDHRSTASRARTPSPESPTPRDRDGRRCRGGRDCAPAGTADTRASARNHTGRRSDRRAGVSQGRHYRHRSSGNS